MLKFCSHWSFDGPNNFIFTQVGNNASGRIPPELKVLDRLRFLTIANTDLTGTTIPYALRELDLLGLCLEDNGLVGVVPTGVANISTLLKRSLVAGNNLTPPVPPDFDNL